MRLRAVHVQRWVPPLLFVPLFLPTSGQAQTVRARDLGIPFGGITGPLNAITDVPGVEVGHTTLIEGDGPLVKGEGPIRTGVTAILPRGHKFDPVFAAWYALNGNGEMTGLPWIEESGFLETPVLITNTFSVGVVRDAVIAWMDSTGYNETPDHGVWYNYPVVAETYDGGLNDILGQHVTREHAIEALNTARSGPVSEGNVGGGTGMVAHEFKGGIGTASRLTGTGHTLGVLVQANYGSRGRFTVAGVPVGKEISDLIPNYDAFFTPGGSIIVVIATDAPLLPHQLQRIAERVPIAIGRLGGLGENSSGDIFLAFSTGNSGAWSGPLGASLDNISNGNMDALFSATVEATEEAILNAMISAKTMTGRNGFTVHALPHERLRDALRKYGRLVDPSSLPRMVDFAPGQLMELVGTYRLVEYGLERRLFTEDEKLYYEFSDSRNRIVLLSDGRLLMLGVAGEWVLEPLPRDPGQPKRLRWIIDGEPDVTLERAQ